MSASDAAALTAAIKEALGTDVTMHTAEAYAESCARFCRAIKQKTASRSSRATLPAPPRNTPQRPPTKETDAATYQAMEALVHNLNTMNSRAGAQVPFSSSNYGTDTSPEGRMTVHNLLPRYGSGGSATAKHPFSRFKFFKVKEGVNYNEGDPNYDLFRHALRCSAKRLFPNFSFWTPRSTCNTINPAIITPRWRTWAAVRASWAMYSITQRKSPAAEAI